MITAIATTVLRLDDSAGLPRRPRTRSTRLRVFGILSAALMLGVLTLARESRAGGLVISAPDITGAPGSSGEFQVLLTNTNPSGGASYNVAGDSFELYLDNANGRVLFTNVAIPGAGSAPYIYSVSTADQLGIPLYTEPNNPFPTNVFTAGDSGYFVKGGYPGYTTVNPGDVYALGLVSYSIAPTASPGGPPIAIDFVGIGTSTSLSDENGNPIAFSTTAGSVTITAVTPEPSSWVLATTAVGIFVLSRVRRRRPIRPGRAA